MVAHASIDNAIPEPLFPLFADLRGRAVLVFGGGGVARRKVAVLARRAREKLEAGLDGSLGLLPRLLARIRRRFRPSGKRRRISERLPEGDLPQLLREGGEGGAEIALERALNEPDATTRRGGVVPVGAGPGDPGLLALTALRALQDADVILHARLSGPGILEFARRDAGRIPVGQRCCSGVQPFAGAA